MKWFKRIVLILFIAIVTVAIVVIADGYGLYKELKPFLKKIILNMNML